MVYSKTMPWELRYPENVDPIPDLRRLVADPYVFSYNVVRSEEQLYTLVTVEFYEGRTGPQDPTLHVINARWGQAGWGRPPQVTVTGVDLGLRGDRTVVLLVIPSIREGVTVYEAIRACNDPTVIDVTGVEDAQTRDRFFLRVLLRPGVTSNEVARIIELYPARLQVPEEATHPDQWLPGSVYQFPEGPRRVAPVRDERGFTVIGHYHYGQTIPPNADVDGPEVFGNPPTAPPPTDLGTIRGRRVETPLFEIMSSPRISLDEIRSRRFNIIDRGIVTGTGWGEVGGELIRVTVTLLTETSTRFERLLVEELDHAA